MIEGVEPSVHHPQDPIGEENDNFNRVFEESEEELARIARRHHSRSVKDSVLELDEVSLKDPKINSDPTFNKLKLFLREFTIQAQDAMKTKTTHTIKDFRYQNRIHDSLRLLLRDIVTTEDIERKKLYLMRVYKWFMNKMNAIGAISLAQKKKEEEFMHPDVFAEAERKKQEKEEKMKAKLRDESYVAEIQKGLFQAGERTIHKEVIPARERIEFYKRRLPYDQNSSLQESTTTRPNTKSSTRIRTAKTRSDTMYGTGFRPSMQSFFTSGAKSEMENLLRVESKGNYGSYIPSHNIVEQKIQKMWRQNQHREVAEKRVQDELKQNMTDWGLAKARYEEDMQRKIENRLYGSNFAARAFVRKQKPKSNYMRNHLNDSDGSSLLSDSEIEEMERIAQEEDQAEGEEDEEFKDKVYVKRPHMGSKTRHHQDIRIRKSRAHTSIRTKRKPPIPRLIDSSRDEGDKLWFENVDPEGARKIAEMNDPKKKKPLAPPPEEGPPKDLGGIRPKTTDAGKRRINMLRRFHGGLIGTKASNMEMINNVFTDGSKKDIVSLSVYNNSRSYRNGKYTHSATHLPGTNARTGFRPQSAPFEFADGTSFNLSIRQDKGEEIAEIDSLKNRLAAEDISFKVDTLKKAFEMPEENEFQVKKYPDVANYLMKNPFPKKKKKKKGKGRKKRRK